MASTASFRSIVLRGRSAATLAAVVSAVALGACEARYDLSAVEAAKRQPLRRTDDLQAIAARGEDFVGVGGHGVVVQSFDRGQTWDRIDLEGRPALIDVAACPDGSFVALDFDGAVFVRGARERSWTRHPFPGRDVALDLTCDPTGRYWLVGEFTTIWRSDDGGVSWATESFDRDAIFTVVQFVNSDAGFVAGEFGTFLATRDGGATWEWLPQVDDAGEFYPHSAVFRSPEEGWLVGLSGAAFHTTDGGETWRRESTPVEVGLFGLTLHGGRPVAVGGLGSVLVRGSTWESIDLEPALFTDLRAVVGAKPGSVFVVGGRGALRLISLGDGVVSATGSPPPVGAGPGTPSPQGADRSDPEGGFATDGDA